MAENYKLLMCIVVPLIFSAAFYLFAYKTIISTPNMGYFSSLKTLDPDRGLAEQGPLWISIILPICISATLVYFAVGDRSIRIDADGFNTFWTACKFPLGILALVIPSAVLVSRFHATKQTAHQIVTTKEKNNIDAFYAHRKAMSDYFSSLTDTPYEGSVIGKFKFHPRLHIKFFKKSSPKNGIPEINSETFEHCFFLLERARGHLGELIDLDIYRAHQQPAQVHYLYAGLFTLELAELLVLPEIYHTLKRTIQLERTSTDKETFKILGESLNDLLGAYRYSRSFLRVVCEFSGYSTDRIDGRGKNLAVDKEQLEFSGVMDKQFGSALDTTRRAYASRHGPYWIDIQTV